MGHPYLYSVAELGFEPRTSAYETLEIPLLHSTIFNAVPVGFEPTRLSTLPRLGSVSASSTTEQYEGSE